MHYFKTIIILLIIHIIPTIADTMYVLSNTAKVMPNASMDGQPINVIQHGEKVKILESKNIWVKVMVNNSPGWICKFSLSFSDPETQTIAQQVNQINLKQHARKRASAYTTAATTRGLNETDDTVVPMADYGALKHMETYKPTQSEVSNFKKKGALK